MQTLPEVGKIYRSTKHPGFLIETTRIETKPDRFFIHALDKSEGANNAPVLIWEEEWIHCKFTPATDHP